MRRPTAVLSAVAALGTLVAAACGSDDADRTGSGDRGCRTIAVEIGEFQFDPTPVRVSRCDSVVWRNTHDQAHTSTGTGDQRWDSGSVSPGASSAAVPFPDAGTFAYVCALHPFMHGEVVVS